MSWCRGPVAPWPGGTAAPQHPGTEGRGARQRGSALRGADVRFAGTNDIVSPERYGRSSHQRRWPIQRPIGLSPEVRMEPSSPTGGGLSSRMRPR
jgi:hypothetical protein